MKSPARKWQIDCATYGVQETWAPSAAKARSNVVWRLRQRGIYPITTYWGEPVAVEEARGVAS